MGTLGRADARALVERFLAEEWRPDRALGDWWDALARSRLAFPGWPEPWGRGWGEEALQARTERFEAHGAIGPPPGLGTLMGAPVLLELGTDEQRTRFLPDLAAGRVGWCQLFSEPGAGSDLAGLTTNAEPDGDELVVTGQKVWTSGADGAAFGMLVARTDWDVPKHAGLTWLVLPMDQPGVEVRPLRQMNGRSHFSEVFLDGARAPLANVVGGTGGGWAVTTATLAHERRGLGAAAIAGPRPDPGPTGPLDRPVGDLLAEHRRRRGGQVEDTATPQALAALAARRPSGTADAGLRQALASLDARFALEAPTAGRVPLLAKLAWTERLRAASALAPRLVGAAGMLVEDDRDAAVRSVADLVLTVPSASIAGGTDEIQRSIIGERALGLPREPTPDRDLPFRAVRRG